jgi:hypothetical protein
MFVVKGLIWACSVVLILWNWITIVTLRRWVHRSGWLNKEEGNPENEVRGIGQLAPLVALGTVGFTLLNGVWAVVKGYSLFSHCNGEDDDNGRRSAAGNSFQMQPVANWPSTS